MFGNFLRTLVKTLTFEGSFSLWNQKTSNKELSFELLTNGQLELFPILNGSSFYSFSELQSSPHDLISAKEAFRNWRRKRSVWRRVPIDHGSLARTLLFYHLKLAKSMHCYRKKSAKAGAALPSCASSWSHGSAERCESMIIMEHSGSCGLLWQVNISVVGSIDGPGGTNSYGQHS